MRKLINIVPEDITYSTKFGTAMKPFLCSSKEASYCQRKWNENENYMPRKSYLAYTQIENFVAYN